MDRTGRRENAASGPTVRGHDSWLPRQEAMRTSFQSCPVRPTGRANTLGAFVSGAAFPVVEASVKRSADSDTNLPFGPLLPLSLSRREFQWNLICWKLRAGVMCRSDV